MKFTVGALHRVCCIVHFASASALLILLASGKHAWSDYKRPVSRSFMTPSQWHYVCWNNATKTYNKVYYCEQNHKQWYIKLPEMHGEFDREFQTATAAVYFSYFSAFCHYIAMLLNLPTFPRTVNECFPFWGAQFKALREINYKNEIFVRAIDYFGTAPVMLALFSVLWNANNVVGVIVSPIVLGVVILFAFRVSYKVCSGNDLVWQVRWKYSIFFALSAVFFTFLSMGTINAVVSQSKRDGITPRGLSQYPPGVVAASSFVLVTFSSFVIPYYFELRDGSRIKNTGEKPLIVANLMSMWTAMSLVSKIILLVAFGAGTQVQTDMLIYEANLEMDQPPSTAFNVDKVTVLVFTVIVLVGIAFFLIVRKWLRNTVKGGTSLEERLVETIKY